MNNHQLKYISIADGISTPTPNNETDLPKLPKALARAIREGWQIGPVSGRSKFVSLTQALLAAPTNDAAEIARWTETYPEANYCVRTGPVGNLVVLEVNHEFGQDSLCELCCDVWADWTDTLRFGDDSTTSLLFRHPTRRLRHLSAKVEGVKLHAAGKLVLVPPSSFVSGSPLGYIDLSASVRECPPFLLASETLGNASGMVIPFPSRKAN